MPPSSPGVMHEAVTMIGGTWLAADLNHIAGRPNNGIICRLVSCRHLSSHATLRCGDADQHFPRVNLGLQATELCV